jgi:Flp pilus assembly protein TadD
LNYGHHEEAFSQFRVAAELVPKSPVPYQEYAAALAANGLDQEAAAQYTQALRRSPNPTQFRASVLYALAVIELKNSESAEGTSHLREALAIDPQAPNYHAALAGALRQQGRTQEADEQMRLEAAVEQRIPAKHAQVHD